MTFIRIRRCGVLLALSVALGAQQPPTIQTNVHLVLVPATVTDRQGNSIDGLQPEDFMVTDDGVKQSFHMDTSDTVLAPVSLVVAVQCTGWSAAVLAKINRVGSIIQPIIAGDRGRAAVIAFDDEIRVLQGFTSDSAKIRTAFARVRATGSKKGKMFDAVAESVKLLETQPENRRRVMILLSESRDRGSKMKLAEAVELVQRAGVAVYPATYSIYATPWTAKPEDNPPTPGNYVDGVIDLARLGKTNSAEALARSTGGRHLSFETLRGLETALIQAGEEIHSQYLLSFVPQQPGNGYHHIEVMIPDRAGAVVRARPGYWPAAN